MGGAKADGDRGILALKRNVEEQITCILHRPPYLFPSGCVCVLQACDILSSCSGAESQQKISSVLVVPCSDTCISPGLTLVWGRFSCSAKLTAGETYGPISVPGAVSGGCLWLCPRGTNGACFTCPRAHREEPGKGKQQAVGPVLPYLPTVWHLPTSCTSLVIISQLKRTTAVLKASKTSLWSCLSFIFGNCPLP